MKKVVFLLLLAPVLMGIGREDVLRLAHQYASFYGRNISEAQKNKILEWVERFPEGDRTCPGYRFREAGGHVITVNRGGAWLQAGVEAVIKGRLEIALWAFARAVEHNPDCPVFLSNAGFVLNRLGKYSDALTLLLRAVELDPLYSSAWVNMAYAHKKRGEKQQARTAYRIAISFNPNVQEYREALRKLTGPRLRTPEPPVNERDLEKVDEAMEVLKKRERRNREARRRPRGNGWISSPEFSSFYMLTEAEAAAAREWFRSANALMGKWGFEFMGAGIRLLKNPKDNFQFLQGAAWFDVGFLWVYGYFKGLEALGEEVDEDMLRKAAERGRRLAEEWEKKYGSSLPPNINISLNFGFDGINFTYAPQDPTGRIGVSVGEGLILSWGAGPRGTYMKIGLGAQMEAGGFGMSKGVFFKVDSLSGLSVESSSTVSVGCVNVEVTNWQHSFSFESI